MNNDNHLPPCLPCPAVVPFLTEALLSADRFLHWCEEKLQQLINDGSSFCDTTDNCISLVVVVLENHCENALIPIDECPNRSYSFGKRERTDSITVATVYQNIGKNERQHDGWRKRGQILRSRLLMKLEKDGDNFLNIDPNGPIEQCYQVADMLLEKLQKHTIRKRKDLLSAYLLASRLCTFLSDTIPSHPDYFSTPISTLASTFSFATSKEDKLKAARKKSQEQLETVLEYLGKITFIIDYEELQTGGLIPRSMLGTTNKIGEEEDSFRKANAACVEWEQALLTKKEGVSRESELYSKSIIEQDEKLQIRSGHQLESTPLQFLAPPLHSKILERFENSQSIDKESARSASILNSTGSFGDENTAWWDIGRAHSENSHIIGQHSISLQWTLDCNKSVASLSGKNKLKRQQRIGLEPLRLHNFVN